MKKPQLTAKKSNPSSYLLCNLTDREEVSWSSSLRRNLSNRESMLKKISTNSYKLGGEFTLRSPPHVNFDRTMPPKKILEQSSSINLSKRDSQTMSPMDQKIMVNRLFRQDKEFNDRLQEEVRQRYLEEEKKTCTFSPYINRCSDQKRSDGSEGVFQRLTSMKVRE